MGTLWMDVAAVRALAEGVLDGANQLDEIDWPAVNPDSLGDSDILLAAACPAAEDRLADVIVHMRAWAAAARSAAVAAQLAEVRQAGRFGAPR